MRHNYLGFYNTFCDDVIIWYNIGRHSIQGIVSQSDDYFGSFACDDLRSLRFFQILRIGKRWPTSISATVLTIEIVSFNDWKFNLNIFRLAGKLETSMCLILQQSTLIIEGNENNSNYMTSAVTRQVLQSYVHRYFACSARYCTTYEMVYCCCNKIRFLRNREIQRCLVLRNAHRILNLIQRHTNNEVKMNHH